MTKIGECFSPCSFPFVDPGGASGAGESFYRVRAVDDDGNAGGMGSEAPQGTVLTLSRTGPGLNDLVLNWAAVTMALDGTAAELSHYALYAADQPFTREEIRDGAVSLLTTVTGTVLDISSQPQDRYYSVVVVDIRGNVSPY
jgi:hypothetical protein